MIRHWLGSAISRGSICALFRGAVVHMLIMASLCSRQVESLTSSEDVNALRALHSAWGRNPSSWDFNTDPCESLWLGVLCDASNTTVTQLFLINQGLSGTLTSAIGDLRNLTNLDLSSNLKLGGSIPKEISNLLHLQKLFIQFCNLSGQIPLEIGSLTSLQYLGLTQNSLSGPLPDTIGLLSKLSWLDVSSNQLNGSLPDSLTSQSGINNLINGQHFYLQNNLFSGNIPESIFNTSMQLIDLLLHKNNFSGDIPSTVEGLIHIEILRLDLNQLSGPIPSNLGNITNLTALYLGSNSFTDSRVPSWISSHKNLRLLSMDSSHLTGNLSADIFSLGPNLSTVSLASNNFTGSLDLSLANAALLLVNVTNNNFTSFVNSNHTVDVILHGNPFCSVNQTRCDELDNLRSSPPVSRNTSLCSNSCSDNSTFNPKLSGNCQCFRPLNANVNFLALKIPSLEVYNLTLMEEQFAVGLNRSTVKSFAIAGSQIVIEPITSTQALVSIFPPTNYATWSVNDAALILYAINNKEILYPSIGPMVCAFIGDPYNTVAIANSRSTNGLSTGAKVGIAMAVIFFVIAMIIASLYAVRQKKRATWIEAGEIDIGSPQLMAAHWFSLQEIRKCTDNFSQSNEIGEGGYGKVYKGYLPSGQKVAIKRAGSDSLQSAAEFKFEIELLSSVHHHNLVGLIGFCFEEGEQILVYEFMPNGTLRESLSGATNIQMDWQRRVSVALNAGRGIVYLHTGVNPQVIHRDIKSSNIFLDDRVFAKVADFGLSKLAPVDNDSTPLSSQVKGTMGYLDPDYFLTNRLTHKSDVYSFGVVLLELITGRPPIQGGKYVVREMRTAYAQGGMEQVVKSMVDPKLKDYPLEALEKLVKLALVSVEDNPQRRPTMTEVMKEVESLSEVTSIKSDVGGKPKNTHLEEGTKAHMRQKLANLFQHSGNYTAMFANVQPK